MAARPSISVIIPTFNRARYLDLTLASYLGQSDRDFELVIVDDGSTDGTAALARELATGRTPVVGFEATPGYVS